VFAVIKSSNSAGTGNNSTNSNSCMQLLLLYYEIYEIFFLVSVTTIASGLLTSSISIGSQTGGPCSGYTQIDDPTRNVNFTEGYNFCDNNYLFNTSNGGAWIRFVGTGGTTIPTSSVDLNHCGAYLSGWYNSTLPVTTNMIINGTVCFNFYASSYAYAVDISVALCSGSPTNYYVYFLPPIGICSARYCTN
jgi:hypothetical protein